MSVLSNVNNDGYTDTELIDSIFIPNSHCQCRHSKTIGTVSPWQLELGVLEDMSLKHLKDSMAMSKVLRLKSLAMALNAFLNM